MPIRGRGPQVVLEGYARNVARGVAGRTMRDNIAAMDQLVIAGLAADGNTVDGSSRTGAQPYDVVVAQYPDETTSAWEIPAPLLNTSGTPSLPFLPLTGGTVTGVVDIINNPADPFINTSPFETHRLMVQIGPNKPVDIGGMSGGTGGPGVAGYFDGIASAITIPSGTTTPSGTQAVAGFVYSRSPFTPGVQNGTAATALYGLAVAGGTNVHVWGQNLVMNDAPSGAADGSTGQVLNGLEFDCNMFNAGTVIHGCPFFIHLRAAPASGSYAFGVATLPQYYPLTYSFGSFQGSATNALLVGSATFTPPTWVASGAYPLNQTIQPTTPNGFSYVCTVAGTSGATEPVWPTSAGTFTDGSITWSFVGSLADPSQVVLFNYVDASATPTPRAIRMQVLPSSLGGNLWISGTAGVAGFTTTGAITSQGISEIGIAFNVPYNAGGNNTVSYSSGNAGGGAGGINFALSCGATQTVPGTNNANMPSQKIGFNFSQTGSATIQQYQLQVVGTATGGTLTVNAAAQDANLSVKTGLIVGAPSGGMGTVGTVKAQGTVTGNAGIVTGTATQWTAGTGTPSGVVTAGRGSLFSRTDGAVGTTLYVSQGGTTWNAVAGV